MSVALRPPTNVTVRVYEKDLTRLIKVRMHLEEQTGRRQSITDTVLFLLDCYDRIVADGKAKRITGEKDD